MKRGTLILGGILLTLSALIAGYVFTQAYEFNGYVLPKPIKAPEIMLRSANGPVSAQILAGPTYTPVVCAVTLVPAHVQSGQWLYEHHCAQCHGMDMAGNPQWQVELADGSRLAPPLNGRGEAWKYSPTDLLTIVKEGRNLDKPIHMPAFKSKLADWEIEFIFSYIQSTWNINQLNYQHGFMTLTPNPTTTPAAPLAPLITSTPSP